MYLEHFNLHFPPFQEQIDPDVFFPGAGRRAVLDRLVRDLDQGRLLIKVIGDEGSGKSLLCRYLAKHPPEAARLVIVDNPSGSFENLLRIVCLEVGMDPLSGATESSCQDMLGTMLATGTLKETSRVALIIDEAEKLFLATLERLIRFIGKQNGSRLQVVLVGRPGLESNLEQLAAYCPDVEVQAGYFLESMNEEETSAYLDYRLQAAGLPPGKSGEIFTRGAVQRIYDRARGNPRMTNILAEESLQTSFAEKSFLVLLDHVQPDRAEVIEASKQKTFSAVLDRIGKNGRLLTLGAGVAAIVLLALFLFRGGQEKQLQRDRPVAQVTAQEPLMRAEEQQPKAAKNDEVAISQELEKSPPAEEKKVVHPTDDAQGKAQEKTSSASGAEGKGIEEDDPPPTTRELARDGDALFEERLRASASWVGGAYRNEYTIQLMMLTSDEAEENIKRDLVRNQYYEFQDKIYILRKTANPPTLFVFFGTYKSMEEARQARNTMPVVLRKHHPYPLSISDALKKTMN